MSDVACVTRPRKLREVLNVRLDEPLARELARIAGSQARSESEVARSLLRYGIEVLRRLEAHDFTRPFAWEDEPEGEPYPGVIEIEARWRPMTEDEIDRHGLRSYVGWPADAEDVP
jgi:hypothetical protein